MHACRRRLLTNHPSADLSLHDHACLKCMLVKPSMIATLQARVLLYLS